MDFDKKLPARGKALAKEPTWVKDLSNPASPNFYDKELDARGLNCPLPILRCKRALAEIFDGQVLKVMATDPGSVKDFQAFCKQTNHELMSTEKIDSVFTFHIRKHCA